MIDWRIIQRFLYSHYLMTGVRQAIGALTPAVVIVASGHSYLTGLTMTIGALCVAIVDQAGGAGSQARNGMLLAMALSVISALLTGLVSAHFTLMWLVIPILTFLFSMLSVYGARGALLGFVSLLIMTLTMRSPMTVSDVLVYAGYLLSGGFFYFIYSLVVRRFLRAREERESLSSALFSMADYLQARAGLYDTRKDIDLSYRDLIRTQSIVVDAVQNIDRGWFEESADTGFPGNREANGTFRLATALQRLLTNFVDTRTDFALLRKGLHAPAVLKAMHETLVSMADRMGQIALNVARNKPTPVQPIAQASLEVIRRELEESANGQVDPEKSSALLILRQVYDRFCRAQAMLNELALHTFETQSGLNSAATQQAVSPLSGSLMMQDRWQFGLYFNSMRLNGVNCRHALRVSVAVLLAMVLSYAMAQVFQAEALKAIGTHGYWVVLTVIVVMKPGFALTQQRNGWRLGGTLIGCCVALLLFHVIHDSAWYLAILFLFGVLGYAFVQLNYLVSALCNTVLVLTAFHLLSPGGEIVVGARFLDTLLGCAVALLCSYILPTWEARFLPGLANELKAANIRLLEAAKSLAEAPQAAAGQARKAWSTAQQGVYVALSRFSASYYRMMSEPVRHQLQPAVFNHLMIENHALAMQVMHVASILRSQPEVDPHISDALGQARRLLEARATASPLQDEHSLATVDDVSNPGLQQLTQAARKIGYDMARLQLQADAPHACVKETPR
ncbi:MAG: hypothetical protein CML16_06110 [Pusillimonas sp.]|mgnify:CR=1 FL=1|nr:hypothetical protein [Pusillimonas sp.]MBC43778.1 hypothetical protein [Pusillimonas sp.]HCP77656.1 hypothetical protein [Pusillimonas sp.]